MKKSRITCDTEVPMPTSNGNKFNHSTGTYHNYSLPHGATITNDKSKQYDKPQRERIIPVEIVGSSSSHGAPVNSIYNNQLSNKRHSDIRNYDIPKDTINSNILERYVSFFFFI